MAEQTARPLSREDAPLVSDERLAMLLCNGVIQALGVLGARMEMLDLALDLRDARAALAAAEQREAALRGLLPHVGHGPLCSRHYNFSDPCDCGLDAARAALAQPDTKGGA